MRTTETTATMVVPSMIDSGKMGECADGLPTQRQAEKIRDRDCFVRPVTKTSAEAPAGGARSRLYPTCRSDVEAEEQNVPVLHDVFLPFRSHDALVAGRLQTAHPGEVVESHRLRPDEAALEIA